MSRINLHYTTGQRQYEVAVTVLHVICKCENFQFSPCICYFVSIWSQLV